HLKYKSRRLVDTFEFVVKPIGEGSDAQHPLPHWSPNDRKTADLALAINHFFIRKDGAEIGTPVHWNLRDVSQSNAIRIVAAKRRHWLGLFRLGAEPGIVNLEKK